MRLKQITLLVGTLFIAPTDNYYLKIDKEKTNDYVLDLKVEPEPLMITNEPEQPNIICSENKFLTYTNIDNINLNNFKLNDFYIDVNGYVRENGTNAIYVAMATNYKKNNYYTITTSDNQSFKVKVVDIKSDNHTTNKCYTTHDNSIVELWLTNRNNDFKHLGNSRVVGVSVVEIKE
jgi:hypothetical protein|nr:MAG TPA: hypothetical protein [Caudoviricetes sp.]